MVCTTIKKFILFFYCFAFLSFSNAADIFGAGDYRDEYNKEFKTKSLSLDYREKNKKSINLIENTIKQIGLPPLIVPTNNSLTKGKVLLGKKLFFDKRLSINNTLSCAMCHIPEQGFGSYELKTSVGLEGRSLKRNAPTLFNISYMDRLFHDSREANLEWQVWSPLLKKNEMGNPSFASVVSRLKNDKDYVTDFDKVFPNEGISVENIGKAIASYERTLSSGSSRFDKWMYDGQKDVLTQDEVLGYKLFTGKAKCSSCHILQKKFSTFTDQKLHNTGIGYKNSMNTKQDKYRVQISPGEFTFIDSKIIDSVSRKQENDLGLYEITLDPKDRWKYRTPSLRNIALTKPYMHDGSLLTLEDVVTFYNEGGFKNPLLSPVLSPLNLSDREQMQLVKFLTSLTGENINELVADAFDH